MPIILGANTLSTGVYEVANSCRFDDGDSAFLSKTFSTDGTSHDIGTVSVWLKRGELAAEQGIFTAGSSNRHFIRFESGDTLTFRAVTDSFHVQTTQVFRDPSAWYHIVIAYDTSQGTASNRVKMYVNGSQISSFSQTDYPDQNLDIKLGAAELNAIGKDSEQTNPYYDGYMAEFVYIDGQQLTPTSFGEFDEDSNIWKPIDVSGLTFGTNGFYLDFEDSGTLGNDVSGNNNDFASSGLAAIDQSTDTPTNNAVTFMPNTPSASNFTLSQGNLQIDKSGSGTFGLYGSSIMLSNGKWYWEAKMTGDAGSDRTRVGLAAYESVTGTSSIQGSYSGFEFTSVTSGRFSVTVDGSTTEIDGFNGYSTGDIIRFALDMDNTKLYVGRNADWFNYNSSNTGGDPTSGSGWVTNNATALAAPVTIYAGHAVGVSGSSELEFNFGATNTFSVSSGNSDGNGYGNFEYAVPSGYYAINSKNLAEYV